MSKIEAPEKPQCSDPEETTVRLSWKAVEGAEKYRVLVKDFAKEGWDGCMTHDFDGNVTSAVIDDLYPTSTFLFKIQAGKADEWSEFSPEADCDTKVANCNPDPRCIIS